MATSPLSTSSFPFFDFSVNPIAQQNPLDNHIGKLTYFTIFSKEAPWNAEIADQTKMALLREKALALITEMNRPEISASEQAIVLTELGSEDLQEYTAILSRVCHELAFLQICHPAEDTPETVIYREIRELKNRLLGEVSGNNSLCMAALRSKIGQKYGFSSGSGTICITDYETACREFSTKLTAENLIDYILRGCLVPHRFTLIFNNYISSIYHNLDPKIQAIFYDRNQNLTWGAVAFILTKFGFIKQNPATNKFYLTEKSLTGPLLSPQPIMLATTRRFIPRATPITTNPNSFFSEEPAYDEATRK